LEGPIQPTHPIVVFGIALLGFGAKKPPELGKGIGDDNIRDLKSAMRSEKKMA
jgi:Sec-independent protein translocase protein TatA